MASKVPTGKSVGWLRVLQQKKGGESGRCVVRWTQSLIKYGTMRSGDCGLYEPMQKSMYCYTDLWQF